MRFTWIESISQLHFDLSMSELRYLASRTIFKDLPFAMMITEFMKVLPSGCSSLFFGEMILYCSSISSIWLNFSCK